MKPVDLPPGTAQTPLELGRRTTKDPKGSTMSQSVTESGPVGSPIVLLQFRPAWDIQVSNNASRVDCRLLLRAFGCQVAKRCCGGRRCAHDFRGVVQAYMRFSGITYYIENVAYPEFDSTGPNCVLLT
jgi:hypothetical protein